MLFYTNLSEHIKSKKNRNDFFEHNAHIFGQNDSILKTTLANS